jgi:hypothetical protein
MDRGHRAGRGRDRSGGSDPHHDRRAGRPDRCTGEAAEDAVEVVRAQTDGLDGIGRINDSGVRILHSARALRKVAVGK